MQYQFLPKITQFVYLDVVCWGVYPTKPTRIRYQTRNRREKVRMDIIGTVIGTGITLAGLIVASHWRMSTRLTAVEKETARLSGLLEGLGMSGRISPRPSASN